MPKKYVPTKDELNFIIKEYCENKKSLKDISDKIHRSKSTISNILKENNITIRSTKETSRKYTHNFDFFEEINTEEKAYWLGFIYADGFIETKRQYGEQKFGITLAIKDKDHLEKFKASINATNPILEYKGSGYNKEGFFCKILLTSQKTVDDLKKYGVVENKTLSLKFPQNLRQDLIMHFIRGYFDGDGHITIANTQFHFGFSGTENMLMNIKNNFNSQADILKDKNIYSFKIGGTIKALKELNKIYENANIYLERKYNAYKIIYKKYSEN